MDSAIAVLFGLLIAAGGAVVLWLQSTNCFDPEVNYLGEGLALILYGVAIGAFGIWQWKNRRTVKDTSFDEWKVIAIGAVPGLGVGLVLIIPTPSEGVVVSIGLAAATSLFGMLCARMASSHAQVHLEKATIPQG